MFTGLVFERGRALGEPQASGQGGRALRVAVSSTLAGRLELGASLAVQGVCLTVVANTLWPSSPDPSAVVDREHLGLADGEEVVEVEVSPETLRRTTLGNLSAGRALNLEPSLRLGDPLGGHWVQGHVDGVGTVSRRVDLTGHRELACRLPPSLGRYVVEKGSLAVDGVSLTVARLEDDGEAVFCWLALIPHTLEVTSLGNLEVGDDVNLEVDVLAKYVERALSTYPR